MENCRRESFSFEEDVGASKLPETSFLRKIGFTYRPGVFDGAKGAGIRIDRD